MVSVARQRENLRKWSRRVHPASLPGGSAPVRMIAQQVNCGGRSHGLGQGKSLRKLTLHSQKQIIRPGGGGWGAQVVSEMAHSNHMHRQRNGKRPKGEKDRQILRNNAGGTSQQICCPTRQAGLLGCILYKDLVKSSLLHRQVVLKAKVLPCRSLSWNPELFTEPWNVDYLLLGRETAKCSLRQRSRLSHRLKTLTSSPEEGQLSTKMSQGIKCANAELTDLPFQYLDAEWHLITRIS